MIIFFAQKTYKNKWMSWVLWVAVVLGILFGGSQTLRADELSMYARSYCLTDGESNRVLAGKNENDAMANASTTKILTCIVTLENCDLEEMVTVSENASKQPKVRWGLKEGKQYPLKDLLYGLMLESYNDCAVAIAEHVAGSEEGFAVMLNQKAEEIGCRDTYFITPNGLDAETEDNFHHTTAWDLCKIMAYCTWNSPKSAKFLEITQTRTYGEFVNRNAFLDQMEGVLSGKTGYTAKAGYCYVAAYEKNGERFCIALLACGWPNNQNYKWSDARTLLGFGKENYDRKRVEVEGVRKEILVDGYLNAPEFEGLNKEHKLLALSEEKEYEMLLSEKDQVTYELIFYTDAKLPIQKGQVMGYLNLYLNGSLFESIPILAEDAVGQWEFEDVLKVIVQRFFELSE